MMFKIRAGTMGLANRTGRTSEEKKCARCNSGSKENETHVLLKCMWGAEKAED